MGEKNLNIFCVKIIFLHDHTTGPFATLPKDNDIGSGLSLRAICFDFCSTNIGRSVIGTCSTTGFDVITL